MVKLRKLGMLVFCVVLHTYVVADELPSPEATGDVSSAEEHVDEKQLEQDIKTTRIQNQVIQGRNKELNSRMKELEARVRELKKSMAQEENNSTKQ